MSYYHPLNYYFVPYSIFKTIICLCCRRKGSGKTTVVHQIMNELPDKRSRHHIQDSYYKENNKLSFDERALINFDHPRAIDTCDLHLKELKAEKTIHQPVYSFVTHNEN
jgi:uridine kinase